jgi:hypothetical protein
MNDQIKQLAEQAGAGWDDKYHWYVGNEQMKKFAELIVRECMEWCDAHATIDGSAQQVRNSIKNHFGVE